MLNWENDPLITQQCAHYTKRISLFRPLSGEGVDRRILRGSGPAPNTPASRLLDQMDETNDNVVSGLGSMISIELQLD